MRRREFIKVIGGVAAVSWPITAHAQQPERIRRIGVVMGVPEQSYVTAFQGALTKLAPKAAIFEPKFAGPLVMRIKSGRSQKN